MNSTALGERARVSAFAADVRRYLLMEPRQLPSKYLYDELGSALFEAICRLPWYRITSAESNLITRHARAILAPLKHPLEMTELGGGSGEKLAQLLHGAGGAGKAGEVSEASGAGKVKRAGEASGTRIAGGEAFEETDEGDIAWPAQVQLIDISEAALERGRDRLRSLGVRRVLTHHRTYEEGLTRAARLRPPKAAELMLFLGSNIGNFDMPAERTLLRGIRRCLRPGDALLLGADLVKPERELQPAYDDPLGVTAAFNKNLLRRVNVELGGSFDLEGFAHRAVWNRQASRMEMQLVSVRRQHVRIEAADLDLAFEPDEPIWTESSYKYEPEQIEWEGLDAGFSSAEQWIDEKARFTLIRFDV